MKKITSFILSIALLCSVIFPAIKFVTSANDDNSAAIAAASENVKEAWGNLQETYEIPFFAYRENGSAIYKMDAGTTSYQPLTQAQLNGEDENFDTEGLPEGITTKEFGSGYFSFATNSTIGASDGHDAALFDMTNNSVWQGKADIAISDIADIYVYYKTYDETAPEDTSTVNSRFYIVNSSSATYTYDSSAPVFAAPKNSGGWKKLSVKDAAPGFLEGCQSTLTGNFMRFNIGFGNGFKSTVTMGGAFVALSVPTPAGLDGLEGVDLLKEYYKNDYSGYVNADALALAILDLEQAIGEDAYLAKLQMGWQNLKKPVQMSLFNYKDSNGTTTTNDMAVPADPTDDKKVVGDKTRTITVASKTNFNGNKDRLVFQLPKAAIDGLEDLTFAYRVNGTVTGTHSIRLQISSDQANYAGTSQLQDIVLDTSEGWHTVKVSDFFKGTTTWQTILDAYAANTNNNWFRLFIYHDAALSITYGTPMLIKDSGTYPTDTEGWSIADWYISAEEINADNYLNADLFVSSREKIAELASDGIAVARLKTGWRKLLKPEEMVLFKYKDSAGGVTQNDFAVPTAAEDQKLVGSATRTINITGANTTDYNANTDCLIFQTTTKDISTMKDILLSYRVDNAGQNQSINIKFDLQSDYNYFTTTAVAPLDMAEGWHSLRFSDLLAKSGLTFDNIISRYAEDDKNSMLRIVLKHSAIQSAQITYGTPIVLKDSGTYPTDNTAKWTPKDWFLAAAEIDADKYYEAEDFVNAYTALSAIYGDSLSIIDIKKAYAGLAFKNYGELKFEKYKNSSGNDATEDENYNKYNSTADGTPSGNITAENLGSAWKNFSVESSAEFGTSNMLVFNANGDNKDVNTIADGEIWYRVESVADGSAAPKAKIQLISNKFSTATGTKNIELIPDGNWHSFTLTDAFGDGWQEKVLAAWQSHTATEDNVSLARMFIRFNITKASITFGSLNLSKKATLPENSDNWTLADWVAEIESLDRTLLVDTTAIDAALAIAKRECEEKGINRYNVPSYIALFEDLTLPEANPLSSITPMISFNGDKDNVTAATDYACLTDGAFGKSFTIECGDSVNYADLAFTCNGIVKVDDIVLAFPENQPNLKYDIYAANSEEKLFTTDSRVLTSDKTEDTALYQANKFSFPNSNLKGRYFGIRFYIDSDYAQANGGSYNISLTELGVYGTESLYILEKGTFNNVKMQSYGENLIAKPEVITSAYVNKGVKDNITIKDGVSYYTYSDKEPEKNRPISNLFDLDEETKAGLAYVSWSSKEEEKSVEVVFDLTKAYTINGILVNNFHQSPYIYLCGHYEVYVSNSKSTLYLSKNRIIDYENSKDSENGATKSQYFDLITPVVGRYVCLRITNPSNDWDTLFAHNNTSAYVRLSDIGVFGEVYNKPLKEINLNQHVITEVYRTDANGNKAKLSENEYSGEMHALVYDGSVNEAATISTSNTKQLDFVFNLAANMELNSLEFQTKTPQINKIKFYASDYESKVWNENSLIYEFDCSNANGGNPVDLVSHYFGDKGLKARYVRYSVISSTGSALEVTEISAFGWNTQEFDYRNLIEESSDTISYYVQDKATYKFTVANPRSNIHESSWSGGKKDRPVTYLVDGNTRTVCDLSYGEQDTDTPKSLNLLIDMGDLKAIDEISFIAGSSEEYWPSKLNFYFGRNDLDLLDASAVPSKVFDSRSADGEYSYKFLPQYARYVRIEVLEGASDYDEYYHRILTVISELSVNGLQVVSSSATDAVATFKDPATGVMVDILKKTENDIYEGVQGIRVTERPATAEDKLALKGMGMIFEGNVYDIELLGPNGEVVNDLDGRGFRVYLPVNSTVDKYIATIYGGDWTLLETAERVGYLSVDIDDIANVEMSFGVAIFDEEAEDEPEEDNNKEENNSEQPGEAEETPEVPTDIGNDDVSEPEEESNDGDYEEDYEFEDTNFEDEEPVEETSEDDGSYLRKVIRKRMVGNNNLWLIITLSVVGAVVVAGGVVLTIVLVKKKKGGK